MDQSQLQLRLLSKVEKELTELYETGEIQRGKLLSQQIENKTNSEFYLNNKVYPGYNFGNLSFDTVFCHLNPGGDPNPSQFKSQFIDPCRDEKEFIENYIEQSIEYAKERFLVRGEFDNFDYKQALFLSGFPDNGIEFASINDSDNGFKNKKNQSKDCFNVLTQKTQIELIPYQSRKFSSIFSSQKQSDELSQIIKPYFEEVLEIITNKHRKYAFFGSSQYEQIITSYNKLYPSFIVKKSEKYKFDVGVAKKVYFTMYKLNWQDKSFHVGIAHSFARQDLPNAFKAMKKYGELCSEKYLSFKSLN